jgi:hypothetical protein
MNFVVVLLLMREPVGLSQSLRQPMTRYHVGRAIATSLANNYIVELRRNYPSIVRVVILTQKSLIASEVLISVAILSEFTCHSNHNADDDFLYSSEAIELG